MAVVDLVFASEQAGTLDTTIAVLERIATEKGAPLGALTDLSAAHLTRGLARRTVRDFVAGIEVADRALHATGDPAARFNLGLGLHLLGLRREAARVWGEYIALDSTSAWAREAVEWRARLTKPHRSYPCRATSAEEMRQAAALEPQQARECGIDELLPTWGRAVLDGRDDEAARAMESLTALASGVATARGDRTLERALAAVRAASADRRRLHTLALAYERLGIANRAFRVARYTDAADVYDQILRERELPGVLRLWAMSGRAAAAVNREEGGRRDTLLARVLAAADSATFPSLTGRAHWALGTIALRDGRFEQSLRHYEAARRQYGLARELGNHAATTYLKAEAELRLGDVDRGLETMRAAIRDLQAHEPSVWLHNALYVMARAVDGEGFPRAATWIGTEDALVTAELDTTRYQRELYMLEARLGRARVVDSRADRARVLDDASPLLDRIADTAIRTTMRHRYGAVRALDPVPHESNVGRGLDSAIDHFRARNAVHLLSALLTRAEARAARRDVAGAAVDLDDAATLLTRQQAFITGEWHRASLLASAKATYDRLVMLEVDAGRLDRALDYLERGRRRRPVRHHEPGGSEAPLLAPPNSVFLTHALVGERLLTWTVDPRGRSFLEARVSPAQITERIGRVRAALQHGRDEVSIRGDLDVLYDVLIRPVASRLTRNGVVVIAEDGMLAGIPFAALRDRRTGRYLVQDHVIVMAPSLRDGAEDYTTQAGKRDAPRAWRALVIGDPAIDSTVFHRLEPLPGAREEAQAIAARYERAELITGRHAQPRIVERALRTAAVVHYGGHAVADDRRPELSFLALAPDEKVPDSDRLTARRLEDLDLRHVRLAVLAACESTSPGVGNAYRGIADGLRAAGVAGVVGSLWKIGDRSTGQLMIAFHEAFAERGAAAEALATAQRRLLKSQMQRLASPSAWGAFQYTGHWDAPQ